MVPGAMVQEGPGQKEGPMASQGQTPEYNILEGKVSGRSSRAGTKVQGCAGPVTSV